LTAQETIRDMSQTRNKINPAQLSEASVSELVDETPLDVEMADFLASIKVMDE